MSVEVVLEGILGKRFGHEWNLQCSTPTEALRIIEANQPGILAWIRNNKEVYSRYRVSCEYENGKSEDLSEENYLMERGPLKKITFEIVIEGAGGNGVLQTIVGAVLIVVGLVITAISGGSASPLGSALISAGIGLMIGGVIQMLTPQPKVDRDEAGGSGKKTSSYFDGPANTTNQGNPVPLCYGRVLAGSQAVSANLVITQVL